jgi:transposase
VETNIDIIAQLLNLGNNWSVEEIKFDKTKKEIDIFIKYSKTKGYFPNTKTIYSVHDYSKVRRIRHLDILDYETYLNFKTPRVMNDSGEIRQIELSWADSRVSFSYLFENKVIELLELSKNQGKTAIHLNVSFDIVHGIMQRAVERGLTRRNLNETKALSIDEKSFGNGHKYITVLSDPITKRVLDIIEGRKIEDTEELLTWTLSPQQLESIELVSMDMWKPFMTAVDNVIPQAQIIHDKFHTAKYLNKGVDDVRKKEVSSQESLKKTKYLFLKNSEDWNEFQRFKFEEIKSINLLTGLAWQLKENFKGIYNQNNRYLCLQYFKEWYIDVINAQIPQMVKVADTILSHLKGIINSAIYEISNSVAENINSQIQVVKSIARGFPNFNGYRNAILFFNGKLNMMISC